MLVCSFPVDETAGQCHVHKNQYRWRSESSRVSVSVSGNEGALQNPLVSLLFIASMKSEVSLPAQI